MYSLPPLRFFNKKDGPRRDRRNNGEKLPENRKKG